MSKLEMPTPRSWESAPDKNLNARMTPATMIDCAARHWLCTTKWPNELLAAVEVWPVCRRTPRPVCAVEWSCSGGQA